MRKVWCLIFVETRDQQLVLYFHPL